MMSGIKNFFSALFGGIFNAVGGLIVIVAVFIMTTGLPIAVVAAFWKPGLTKVRNYVNANEELNEPFRNDPYAEICVDKKLLYNKFYIKSNNKIYYIGYGCLWMKKIGTGRYKQLETKKGLDACVGLEE
jgi:hypothetical protein